LDSIPADLSFVGPKETFWLNESESSKGKGAYSFDLSNEKSGMYYIRLVNSSGVSFTAKVVLQR